MKTKKQNSVIIVSVLVCVFLFGTHRLVQAGSYVQRELIPGQEQPTNNFIEYLGNLYTFGISIAAILAIFMIAVGAFVYIVSSAGNSSKMGNAKDMIFNAIYGLIIALIAYLVLFVVNPDLVRGRIDEAPKAIDYQRSDGRH